MEPRCETLPARASSQEATSQKQELPAGNPAAGTRKTPVDPRCETRPARASSPEATSQKRKVPSIPPPGNVEERESTALMTGNTTIDLSACSLVVYDERNDVPGVKFVAEDGEGWTPVVKGKDVYNRSAKGGKEKEPTVDGDGSIDNPRNSKDEKLQLYRAKEIKYVEMNGTPGLTYRKGRTKHSYEWTPIAFGSPIATRTRTKLKS